MSTHGCTPGRCYVCKKDYQCIICHGNDCTSELGRFSSDKWIQGTRTLAYHGGDPTGTLDLIWGPDLSLNTGYLYCGDSVPIIHINIPDSGFPISEPIWCT